ncbi:MAG: ArnT family glycosyltransferase [Candidatus Woesearchaeota archaeon]
MKTSVTIATILTLIIQLLLLTQATGPTIESYEHLTYAEHIQETGLPLLQDEKTWNQATYDYPPLYHYLIAFLALFMNTITAAFIITTLATASIPYLTYKLTEHVSTHQQAPSITALASSFSPLLYQQTTLQTTPYTLAIPLILLTLHAYISTTRSPKHQTLLLISTTALALTTPLSILVAIGLLLAVTLTKIQQKEVPKKTVEATLLVTFVSIWAALITYNNTIRDHGIQTFWNHSNQLADITTIVAGIGILTVLAGSYAAYTYIQDKTTTKAYPILGVILAIILAMSTNVINNNQAILLLSLLLLPLTAKTINLYTQEKHKARIPQSYNALAAIIIILFLTAHALPAITNAPETLTQTLTPQQQELLTTLPPSEHTHHWNEELGFALHYHGHKTLLTSNQYANKHSQETKETINQLPTATLTQQVHILNDLGVQRIITTTPSKYTLPCYTRVHTTNYYEVNQLQCVVQSQQLSY